MRTGNIAAFTAIVLSSTPGCIGRNIPYEGGSLDTAVEVVACGDESGFDVGYRIEGTTRDLATGSPLTFDEAAGEQGLCVFAVDPTKALAGQDPDIVASSYVCADGRYVLQGITAKPALGLFVAIDDGGKLGCDYSGDATVMLTATDGGAILDIEALSLSSEHAAALQADLGGYGYVPEDGSLEADGFMGGFILDSAEAPVGGATITCSSCDATYYWDQDPADGIFGAGATANTSTDSAAEGMFLIPGAGITNYTTADDGSHTWEPKLYGSVPEYAVFIRLVAQ
jgi:hypothetical protein